MKVTVGLYGIINRGDGFDMVINNILEKNNVCILVGLNSQGKTTLLSNFNDTNKKNAIFINNEVRANEYIKNSASNSPLIQWLQKLIEIKDIQDSINKQLSTIDLDDINRMSKVDISLSSSTDDYKGLVKVDINTSSNQWHKPGSGETFLAELLLVKKMLNPSIKNPIKYLIIDEPETFLHPSLFSSVCEVLNDISTYTKILIATHSPKFLECMNVNLCSVAYVNDGNLFPLKSDLEYQNELNNISLYSMILNYSDEELEKKHCYKNIRKIMNNFDKYFNIFIKPKIIQALFSKIVVIGEGRTEKILFDCCKKENINIYSSQIEYIDFYGKEFMLFLVEIIQSIGIKVVLIFDCDINKSDELNLNLNNTLMNFPNIHFEKEIENYLNITKEKNDGNFKSITSPMVVYSMYLDKNKGLLDLMNKLDTLIKNVM